MKRMMIGLSLLLLPACSASFQVELKSTATIKGGTLFQRLLGDTFGDFGNIDVAQASEFKNAGVRRDQIDSVKLSSLKLDLKSPAGGTFAFLDAITFYVEAEGQPKVKVAEKLSIPDDATSVSLDVLGVELAPYVAAPKLSLTTEATARAPDADTTLQATVHFDFDPRVF